MMILMTWGVQNWPKVDDVIYGRSLRMMNQKILVIMNKAGHRGETVLNL